MATTKKSEAAPSIRRGVSIRAKLLLYASLVLIGPMLFYGVVAFVTAREALLPAIHEQLADDAVTVKGGVEELLTAHYLNVRTWAHLAIMRELVVRDIDKTISRFLESVREDYGIYLDVVVLDSDGVCRASSSAGDLGSDLRDALSSGTHKLSATARQLPHVAWSSKHQTWYIKMAAPIPDPDRPGRYLGVLVALLDRSVLDDVVIPKPGHRHVELRLVDEDGHVMAGPGVEQATAQSLEAWGLHETQPGQLLGRDSERGRAPRLRRGIDSTGRELLVAEAAMGAHGALPDLGWKLSASVPTSVALAPVTSVRKRVLLSGSVLICLGVLAAWLLASRISRPVKDLTAIAKRIADTGLLESVPNPVSRDEIGELTLAFQKMVAAVAAANEELVQSSKLAFLGELAAGIAHEIRTPLGIIKNAAQLLERRAGATDDGQAGEWAVFIREETDRLNGVVTALLDLARPAPPDKGPVDLGAVLRRAAHFLASEAQSRGVDIECTTAPDLPDVVCDSRQIYQVCLNLLMNALQACSRGGHVKAATRGGRITASTRCDGSTVEIVVRDDGSGIPEELLERLFEPFATKREGGIGLGLAIVRRIVASHGGRVEARNLPERGAEFTVTLPIGIEGNPDET
ncbi:MAG: HAMP domain-containing protein [Deltaproteobacteria bacterium]|nr:HAMP domain-containing protein [Deltaproteobacteria bacterium]